MNETLTKKQRKNLMLWVEQHPEVLDYKVNLRQYEDTVQDLERQLDEQTAALGALASVLAELNTVSAICPSCRSRGNRHKEHCRLAQALAPGAVQQAIAAWKAKDEEIERLRETEARLAVATELLRRYRQTYDSIAAIEAIEKEVDDFLADPSPAVAQDREALFKLGDFALHSGSKSSWKIECDTLTDADWKALAAMIAERQTFSRVIGVPSQKGHKPNGLIFAKALEQYATNGPVLVVDDVLTTGESIHDMMLEYPGSVGWVVFARGDCPPGVQALFQMPTAQHREALAVMGRIKAKLHILDEEQAANAAFGNLSLRLVFQGLLNELLGDAQETALSAADDPLLAKLWDNPEDAIYDEEKP